VHKFDSCRGHSFDCANHWLREELASSARPKRGRSSPPTFGAVPRSAWRRGGLDPIGFHEARHTFASTLIAAGVNAKAITNYMGHASIQTTYDLYGKLMPGSESEATAPVGAYLARADRSSRIAQLDDGS